VTGMEVAELDGTPRMGPTVSFCSYFITSRSACLPPSLFFFLRPLFSSMVVRCHDPGKFILLFAEDAF
jgi:hypothetical protein